MALAASHYPTALARGTFVDPFLHLPSRHTHTYRHNAHIYTHTHTHTHTQHTHAHTHTSTRASFFLTHTQHTHTRTRTRTRTRTHTHTHARTHTHTHTHTRTHAHTHTHTHTHARAARCALKKVASPFPTARGSAHQVAHRHRVSHRHRLPGLHHGAGGGDCERVCQGRGCGLDTQTTRRKGAGHAVKANPFVDRKLWWRAACASALQRRVVDIA